MIVNYKWLHQILKILIWLKNLIKDSKLKNYLLDLRLIIVHQEDLQVKNVQSNINEKWENKLLVLKEGIHITKLQKDQVIKLINKDFLKAKINSELRYLKRKRILNKFHHMFYMNKMFQLTKWVQQLIPWVMQIQFKFLNLMSCISKFRSWNSR